MSPGSSRRFNPESHLFGASPEAQEGSSVEGVRRTDGQPLQDLAKIRLPDPDSFPAAQTGLVFQNLFRGDHDACIAIANAV